jgi:hypothetical protein
MTTKEHLEKHDRQIASIRELILQGMRMVVEARKDQREMRKDLRELAAAQKRTEASLKAFIDSMRGGGNGHTKRKLDLP